MKKYIHCPVCFRTYLSTKREDGFVVRKHYQKVPDTNSRGVTLLPPKKYVCKGSGAVVTLIDLSGVFHE